MTSHHFFIYHMLFHLTNYIYTMQSMRSLSIPLSLQRMVAQLDVILRQIYQYRILLIALSVTSGTHHSSLRNDNRFTSQFLLLASIIYRIILYPLYVSLLRHLPGPPLFKVSNWYNPLSWIIAPIKGQFPDIINGEAGIPQRAWLKQYGREKGVIRVVGPVGIERLIFLSPEACERILVKEWTEYPRV